MTKNSVPTAQTIERAGTRSASVKKAKKGGISSDAYDSMILEPDYNRSESYVDICLQIHDDTVDNENLQLDLWICKTLVNRIIHDAEID